MPLRPWPTLSETHRGNFRVFDVRAYERQAPATGLTHTFYVVESCDWVNVVPVTSSGQIVFVRQYRHGTRSFTLELPGGMIDAEDASPTAAGLRELAEETGYAATRSVDLGYVEPNPAIQNNRCHTVLALGAEKVAEQRLDGAEEIEVVLVDPADVPGLIASHAITHALVVAAFHRYALWQAGEAARENGAAPMP